MVTDHLWLRSGYVFIVVTGRDRQQRFLVQQRSMQKSYCPGCFDLTSGGVFEPGEGKRENAVREVQEELGLTQELSLGGRTYLPCLTDCGYFKYHYPPLTKVWCSLWVMRVKEEQVEHQLKLQQEEVSAVQFWTKQEVLERIA